MTSTETPSTQTFPLKSLIRQTADTVTLVFDTWFPYRPGQSVRVAFPGDSKKRYYSLSSSPTEKGVLALTVKCPPNHPLQTVIAGLHPGDAVGLQGPLGSFGLPERLEGSFYFLAAGSGVTPIRSMIKFLMDQKVTAEKWLFYSIRTSADEIFKMEFDAWADADPSFHRIMTVTRSQDPSPPFVQGRIGQTLLEKHLSKMDGHFFLCGPQEFVKDMEHLLRNTLHIPAENIRREQWS